MVVPPAQILQPIAAYRILAVGSRVDLAIGRSLVWADHEKSEGSKASRSLDRILALSDGVFAIALTLLVLNIEVPEIPGDPVAEELPGELLDLWPKFLSYLLSFVVIIFYWIAHHSIFGLIKDHDRVLVWLNSLFLLCVAFLPFPTALLGEYGDQQLVVAIYAGSLAIMRLLLSLVWWYVSQAAPGEYRHGPEYDEGVRYPSLGRTAHFPGFDSHLFLQRNRRRIFLAAIGDRGFRTLTRATPIQIARLLETIHSRHKHLSTGAYPLTRFFYFLFYDRRRRSSED
jgi:uncharacterized membrane protein